MQFNQWLTDLTSDPLTQYPDQVDHRSGFNNIAINASIVNHPNLQSHMITFSSIDATLDFGIDKLAKFLPRYENDCHITKPFAT